MGARRLGRTTAMLRSAFALALVGLALLVPAAPAGPPAQETIALPPEFRPEGIASGPHDSFYVGSIPQGSVYRGSYRTGQGDVLVPPHPGRSHTGLKVDRRFGRIFVAGGDSKGIYVYDLDTGADVASFTLPDAGFLNDVVLTRRAAYFTDSLVQQLYRVRIGRHGGLGQPTRIPISGDLEYEDGFNANGIVAVPNTRRLIVVQSNTGELFSVHRRTGRSRQIPLNGTVTNGDGLLRRGRTLYVVRNTDNEVAVVKLRRRFRSGAIGDGLTDPNLDVPTTIARFKRFLYAVNARFDRPDVSDADIVRLEP
jgi:hypothetical protein